MNIVGLVGYKRVGKDTVANYLLEYKLYLRYGFADPIYRMTEGLFSSESSAIHHQLKQMYQEALNDRERPIFPYSDISLRLLLKTLGTEWGQYLIASDFWIKFAEFQYQHWNGIPLRGMVLSDVRFENQAQWILSKPNSLLLEIKGSSKRGDHISEQYEDWIGKYPHKTITNYGSRQELYEQVSKVIL